MMEPKGSFSVWFFVGVSLLVNGILVFGAGVYELANPPELRVVLYNLHASIWWGAILAILGVVYCYHFSPWRRSQG